MGRAPCCDKSNVKRGPWSPEEDATLKSYIDQHGTGGNWIALPQKIGLRRCGKSCRLRWLNYLRPNIKHGGFSEEEDNIICSLYISIGSRWSIIAAQLPGRTDNDIKNYWNTRLKKKLLGRQRKEQQAAARRASCLMKQEMKTESFSTNNNYFMVPDQTPYCWPVLNMPVATTIPNLQDQQQQQQQPCFDEQESIKKLLIKLGGRFSDEYQQNPENNNIGPTFQYPLDHFPSAMVDMVGSLSYDDNVNVGGGPNMFHNDGLMTDNFVVNELNDQEIFYGNQQAGSNEMESFGFEMRINGSSGATTGTTPGTSTYSAESITSWGDVSSLASCYRDPMLTNYESFQHGLLQNPTFDESRYYGSQ